MPTNQTERSSVTFELHSLLRDILCNLWVVLLAALTGLMSVYIWSHSIYTPAYTSTATLIANIKNSSYYTYTNLSASSEMAKIFTEVFVQPAMTTKAAEHLEMSGFDGRVSAKALQNTNIFTVSVTASSPELAYRELNAILTVYPQISEAVFSDSVIEIMRAPNVPKAPSNSITTKYKALAVGGCAAAALGLIVLLSLMRETVKDEASFHKQIDAKLLGTVVHEAKHQKLQNILRRQKAPLLISNAYASFRFTENYQRIATRIEYMHHSGKDKLFLVTSVAENEGKSTTAANIAIALASRGNRVLLMDMDFKKPAVQKIFGVDVPGDNDLALMLSKRIAPKDYILHQYKNSTLYLALNATAHSDYVDWIHTDFVTDIIGIFRDKLFDYILIDTPPLSVAADVTTLSQIADKTLLVVRTDCVPAADINDAVLSITDSGGSLAGCILNDVRREISLMGQLGFDETGYYSQRYNAYGRYANYDKYAKYAVADEFSPTLDMNISSASSTPNSMNTDTKS